MDKGQEPDAGQELGGAEELDDAEGLDCGLELDVIKICCSNYYLARYQSKESIFVRISTLRIAQLPRLTKPTILLRQ